MYLGGGCDGHAASCSLAEECSEGWVGNEGRGPVQGDLGQHQQQLAAAVCLLLTLLCTCLHAPQCSVSTKVNLRYNAEGYFIYLCSLCTLFPCTTWPGLALPGARIVPYSVEVGRSQAGDE